MALRTVAVQLGPVILLMDNILGIAVMVRILVHVLRADLAQVALDGVHIGVEPVVGLAVLRSVHTAVVVRESGELGVGYDRDRAVLYYHSIHGTALARPSESWRG